MEMVNQIYDVAPCFVILLGAGSGGSGVAKGVCDRNQQRLL